MRSVILNAEARSEATNKNAWSGIEGSRSFTWTNKRSVRHLRTTGKTQQHRLDTAERIMPANGTNERAVQDVSETLREGLG